MSSHAKEPSTPVEVLIPALKGFGISAILAAVLLFSFAGIALGISDPDSIIAPLGYGALYISCAVAGAVAARLQGGIGSAALISATISGILILFTVVLMSFLPAESATGDISALTAIIMFAGIPATSLVGGLILRRKPVKRAKHRRRR